MGRPTSSHSVQTNTDSSHPSTHIRLIIPEEVVMQPRFTVGVLVLQVEGWVSSSGYVGFHFQMIPAGVVAEPQEVAVFIGYLSWDADLAQW